MPEDSIENILDNPMLYEGTYLQFLGFRLTTWKEGFARLEMPVRKDHRNTVGYLHGGVVSSLLDIAGAVAGSHGVSKELVSVTVNLNTNFMSPHTGGVAIAEGAGGEGAAVPAPAVEDQRVVAIREPGVALRVLQVGAHLEEAAGNVAGSRHVAAGELVGLSHVEKIPAFPVGLGEDPLRLLGRDLLDH